MANQAVTTIASQVDPTFNTDGVLISNELNPVKAVSAAYTATVADYNILCTASSAYQVTLPACGTTQGNALKGDCFCIVKDAGANIITIAPASGTINGAASITLAASAYHGATLLSDGANYWIKFQY